MRGDQLARQWRLIQLLARRRYGVGLDDLAAELECTKRTVYRDLDALQFAGFPVTSEKRDGRVLYRLIEGFELGEAPFTPDELMALAFGEDLLRGLVDTRHLAYFAVMILAFLVLTKASVESVRWR